MSDEDVLVVVAFRSTAPEIERRVMAILALATLDRPAEVFAWPVPEITHAAKIRLGLGRALECVLGFGALNRLLEVTDRADSETSHPAGAKRPSSKAASEPSSAVHQPKQPS